MTTRKILVVCLMLLIPFGVWAQENDEQGIVFLEARAFADSASALARRSKLSEAIQQAEKCVEAYKAINYRKKSYLAVAKVNLAAYYAARSFPGDVQKAIMLTEEVLKILPKKSIESITAMYSLSSYYTQAGDTKKAKDIMGQIKKFKTKDFTGNPLALATNYANQAVLRAQQCDYRQAYTLYQEATRIFEENGKEHTVDYCRLTFLGASFLSEMQRYSESYELLDKVRPVLLELEGKNGANYTRCLQELSSISSWMGNQEKADDYINEIGERTGEVTPMAARGLFQMAENLAQKGNYKWALAKALEGMAMYEQLGNQSNIAEGLSELSGYYSHNGQLDTAIVYCQRSLDCYDKLPPTTEKASALLRMLNYQRSAQNYDLAADCARQAVEVCRQMGDTLSARYANILCSQAVIVYLQGHIHEAVAITQEAVRVQEAVFGTEHPSNMRCYNNMAVYAYELKDPKMLEEYYHKAITIQTKTVRNNFSHMSTASRENYWKAQKSIFDYALSYATVDGIRDTLATDVYNALLFTKGILLNSEIDFRELLHRSSSPEIQDQYEQLASLTNQLKDLQAQNDPNSQSEIESLQYKMDVCQRKIVKACKEFGDFTQNMSISAGDVAGALRDDEVAMEIFDVKFQDGTIDYMALYLRHGWKAPKVVRLFSLKEMNALEVSRGDFLSRLKNRRGINEVFSSPEVATLVWKKLQDQWDGIRKVYFAPSGIFYQWAVEYLMAEDGQRMIDKYDFYRLSSTKLLCQRSEQSPLRKAVIYGGLEYDASPNDILMAAQLRSQEKTWDREHDEEMMLAMLQGQNDSIAVDDYAMDTRDMGEALTRGDSISYLIGTYFEAEKIYDMLLQNDIDVDVYLKKDGSEDSFLKLDGSDMDLLHIATHGFCFTENQAARLDNVFIESQDGADYDKTLEYSGLLLSGAQNAFSQTYPYPDGMHNGVLTAHEISKLDLSKVQLGVLSACQTGLGQIKEDGVFGLQRGFKKAGVKSLLMSLWSVDDGATEQMMTGFYEGLCSGLSYSQAFRQAQHRLIDGNYSAPYFWASFILLDQMQ